MFKVSEARRLQRHGRNRSEIAQHEAEEWPPVCIGRYYQPERPAMPETDKIISSEK